MTSSRTRASSRTQRSGKLSLRARAPIREIECDHFKAFLSFTAEFDGDAYLVGPNNSGKSTLIAAMRAAARLLRQAHRRDPDSTWLGPEGTRPAWTFGTEESGLIDENIHHEFMEDAATLRVRFDSGCLLVARWPRADGNGSNERPSFTLLEDTGWTPTTATEVGRGFSEIGIVPILGPVEQEEKLEPQRRVETNYDTRLASRFFRNDLYLNQGDGAAFRAFAERWLPEVTLAPVRLSQLEGGYLDVFYTEGTRHEKELFWAGDGIQVFVQLLWHLFHQWNASTVILDEPEVFLHADLQRRLVAILTEMPAQAITATHAQEVIAEAPARAIVWVSKDREHAVTAPDAAVLDELSKSLGSGFNLRLARALRARVALFVEGHDMKILRSLAATVGATSVAHERGVVVESFGGYTKRASAQAFAWLTGHLLGDSVTCFVVLDSDYRPQHVLDEAALELRASGAIPHIWKRKELENYLLAPGAIARLSGATVTDVRKLLDAVSDPLKGKVRTTLASDYLAAGGSTDHDAVSAAITAALSRVDEAWDTLESRLAMCPAKSVIKGLNREFQARRLKPVAAELLAAELRPPEIADEMRTLLLDVEQACRRNDGEG
jgi:energy-coupling factor transporter ATP-binding protein EcfA2